MVKKVKDIEAQASIENQAREEVYTNATEQKVKAPVVEQTADQLKKLVEERDRRIADLQNQLGEKEKTLTLLKDVVVKINNVAMPMFSQAYEITYGVRIISDIMKQNGLEIK